MASRGLVQLARLKAATCRIWNRCVVHDCSVSIATSGHRARFLSTMPPPPASAPSQQPPNEAPSGSQPPPPASEQPPASEEEHTLKEGLQCGGFFFAVDPNIGLWNDRVNPNWRFTFTDRQTLTKQRIPYAFAIQNKGPHFELAVRLQFGFVQCDNSFAVPPQSFDVEGGWEFCLPLPFSGLRIGHTTLRADGLEGKSTANVYCIDFPVGFCAGFQKCLSGVGAKGAPDATAMRGDVAMVAYVIAIIFGVYTIFTLPGTWSDLVDALSNLDADLEQDTLMQFFEVLDRDGDGYITREDLQELFRQTPELRVGDADALFDRLDPMGTGRVDFDQFERCIGPLLEALENDPNGLNSFGGLNMSSSKPQRQDVDMKPFGGVLTPAITPGFSPLLGSVRPPTGAGPRSPWS